MKKEMIDLLTAMLKNKEQVIESLLRDISTSMANNQAFTSLCELYDRGEQVSTDKALKAAAKSLRHLNEVNSRLLLMLVVYSSSDSFSADVAKILVRLGDGEAALQELMRQKMRGAS